MPTVDEILAQQGRVLSQQSRPGLPALPGPLASPANANLGIVGNVLSRILTRPASDAAVPPQPAAPAAAAPLDPRNALIVAPPAPRPAPPVPHASPQAVAIHRTNVMRLHEIIGSPFSKHETRRINQVAATELLRLGREASEEELTDVARELLEEFNAGGPGPAAGGR
jgi:hypothetical protein